MCILCNAHCAHFVVNINVITLYRVLHHSFHVLTDSICLNESIQYKEETITKSFIANKLCDYYCAGVYY